MIYCIGERAKYEAKLASGEPVYKLGRGFRKGRYYEGGSVWRTEKDAIAFINEKNLQESHAVYAVLADWEADAVHVPRVSFRQLVKAAQVVRLPGDGGDGPGAGVSE